MYTYIVYVYIYRYLLHSQQFAMLALILSGDGFILIYVAFVELLFSFSEFVVPNFFVSLYINSLSSFEFRVWLVLILFFMCMLEFTFAYALRMP